MTMHLLYIEAINLSQVIDDTQDLATRRAGSQMLLDMVHTLSQKLVSVSSAVSTGASKGLFMAGSGQALGRAKAIALDVLRSPPYDLLQVEVVGSDEVPANGLGFAELTALLQAEVRRRQAAGMSLRLDVQPSPGDLEAFIKVNNDIVAGLASAQEVCHFDQVRPAVLKLRSKTGNDGQSLAASWSVAYRRVEGRRLRQRLFGRLLDKGLGSAREDSFTDDLEALSVSPIKRLSGKVALLYVDGNAFGKIAQACSTPEQLQAWDRSLQGERKRFLSALLDIVRERQASAYPGRPLPLEALMWGGDEFLLVLPAELGLKAAQCFFDYCHPELPQGVADLPSPSHAVSLVFAHHNSPIEPLQRLVKDLAEQGKQGRYKGQDSLTTLVLESFDHAGSDLASYWQRRGLGNIHWADVTLNPHRLAELLALSPMLLTQLPRSALYKILADLVVWSRHPADEPPSLLVRRYETLMSAVASPEQARLRRLWKALQPQAQGQQTALSLDAPEVAHLNAWLMLLELWDYLPSSPILSEQQP